jgi:hypothetical protein
VVAVLGAVSAAGCSSSSTRPTSARSATSAAPPTSTPAGSAADVGSASTGAVAIFHGSSRSKFCDLARKDRATFAGARVETASQTRVKELYENVGSALDQARAEAPGEIKGDFEVFMAAYWPFLKALAAAHYDVAKVSDATRRLGTPAVTIASARITQYVQQVCDAR